LVDYLGLEEALGPCIFVEGARPVDSPKFTSVSNHIVVQRTMLDGHWTETAVTPENFTHFGACISNHSVTVGPAMAPGQVYCVRLLFTQTPVSFGIGKHGSCSSGTPDATTFGWNLQTSGFGTKAGCLAGGESTHMPATKAIPEHVLLQVDLAAGHLACINLDPMAQSKSCLSDYRMDVPLPAQMQLSFTIQAITDVRFVTKITILPVSEVDKQLFADASCFDKP